MKTNKKIFTPAEIHPVSFEKNNVIATSSMIEPKAGPRTGSRGISGVNFGNLGY